jgi:hypothetical protein
MDCDKNDVDSFPISIHGWGSAQCLCISATTRRRKAHAWKLGHRRPPQGLGLELRCTPPQRGLDDARQLIYSSSKSEEQRGAQEAQGPTPDPAVHAQGRQV